MDHLVCRDRSAANTCSNREIKEIRNALRRAPARFTHSGRVDIGIETHRYAERFADGTCKIAISPGSFRGRGDVSPGTGMRVGADGSKGSDAGGFQFACACGAQEFDYRADCDARFRGRNLNGAEIVRAGADSADELCSSRLNYCVQRWPSETGCHRRRWSRAFSRCPARWQRRR